MAVYWAENYLYYGLPGETYKLPGDTPAPGSRSGTLLTFTPLAFPTVVASVQAYSKHTGIGNDWAHLDRSVYGVWSKQVFGTFYAWYPSNGAWPPGSGYAACKAWINANYPGTGLDGGWKNVRTANQTFQCRASWGTVNAQYHTVTCIWNEIVHYSDIIPPSVTAKGWQWLVSCFPLLTVLALGGAADY